MTSPWTGQDITLPREGENDIDTQTHRQQKTRERKLTAANSLGSIASTMTSLSRLSRPENKMLVEMTSWILDDTQPSAKREKPCVALFSTHTRRTAQPPVWTCSSQDGAHAHVPHAENTDHKTAENRSGRPQGTKGNSGQQVPRSTSCSARYGAPICPKLSTTAASQPCARNGIKIHTQKTSEHACKLPERGLGSVGDVPGACGVGFGHNRRDPARLDGDGRCTHSLAAAAAPVRRNVRIFRFRHHNPTVGGVGNNSVARAEG